HHRRAGAARARPGARDPGPGGLPDQPAADLRDHGPLQLLTLLRRSSLAALLGWLLATPAGAAGEPPLVYAGDAQYPPFESLDAQGRPQGFNVELVRAL